jgi:hypothetical protein
MSKQAKGAGRPRVRYAAATPGRKSRISAAQSGSAGDVSTAKLTLEDRRLGLRPTSGTSGTGKNPRPSATT